MENNSIPQRSIARRKQRQIQQKKQRRVILFSIIALLALLLIAMGILVCSLFSPQAQDDGRIRENVYLLDLDLGGMTPEEARRALQKHILPRLQTPLVIQLPDTKLEFTPEKTQISLDVDALVQAAYTVGRGSNAPGRHTLNLLDYLTLDTNYIKLLLTGQNALVQSTLTQPTVTLEGERPQVPENPLEDPVEHQMLVITMGLPERYLDTETLYSRILDAYNSLDLAPIATEYYVQAPSVPDLGQAWLDYCQEAVNASLDQRTYEITDEVWGYGFDIQVATVAVNNAPEGAVIRVKMEFLAPDVTRQMLEKQLFQDTLGSATLAYPSDATKDNAKIDAGKLTDLILLPGQEFSFTDTVGPRKYEEGYTGGDLYMDGFLPSALYQAALLAELTVTERSSHIHAPSFTDAGLDALAVYGATDLCLRNDSAYPVRILVTAGANGVTVSIEGTDNRSYVPFLVTEVTHIDKYATLYVPAPVDEVDENGDPIVYQSGDILQVGINGLTVECQLHRKDKATGQLSRILIETSEYVRLDQLIAE